MTQRPEWLTDDLAELIQHEFGSLSEAARIAGVDRTTLYRLMDKHELSREEILQQGEGDG